MSPGESALARAKAALASSKRRQLHQCAAREVVGSFELGIEGDRALELGDRFRVAACPEEAVAEAGGERRRGGLELHRAPCRGDSLVAAHRDLEDERQPRVRLRALRLQLQRTAQRSLGSGPVPIGVQADEAERGVSFGEVGRELEGALRGIPCAGVVVGERASIGEPSPRGRVGRVGVECALEVSDRFVHGIRRALAEQRSPARGSARRVRWRRSRLRCGHRRRRETGDEERG